MKMYYESERRVNGTHLLILQLEPQEGVCVKHQEIRLLIQYCMFLLSHRLKGCGHVHAGHSVTVNHACHQFCPLNNVPGPLRTSFSAMPRGAPLAACQSI